MHLTYLSSWKRKLKLAPSTTEKRKKDVLDGADSVNVNITIPITPIFSDDVKVLLNETQWASQSGKDGYARRFHDKFFLFLFLVTISAMIYLTIDFWISDIISKRSNFSDNFPHRQMFITSLQILIISILISAICSVLVIFTGKLFIWLSLISVAGTQFALAGTFLKEAILTSSMVGYTASILIGIVALVFIISIYVMRHRVEFACAHLGVAGRAILSSPVILLAAVFMAVIQSFWSLIWILGMLRVLDYFKIGTKTGCVGNECLIHVTNQSAIGISIGMLFIYFWGSIIFRNILAVTVASIVSSWKCHIHKNSRVGNAFLEAWTYHLGSVCFGSLLVAVVETVRKVLSTLVALASRRKRFYLAWLFSMISSTLHFVEYLMEFCNRFAYAYIGCYKCAFIPASKRSMQFLKTKGWSAVVNQEITRTAFWYANLLSGSTVAFIILRISDIAYSHELAFFQYQKHMVAAVGFVIGYLVNTVVMSVISSAVTTVYVLWAEDPTSWIRTRPKEYQILHNVWSKIYPDDYNSGFGANSNSVS
uniref:Choline transporter-like protein n=1 Tax=Albugo laibachii Nc14 TaxID=890382 RepID=F0WXC2_9STRA|nr:PNS1like protein putative [Albugo laibachii Nc14]|eukprot:CCA26114.1 PNS1like protein putative [Albugo laibachii Nc14]